MNNLFIIPIEPIETRYTKHWFEYIPKQFKENLKNWNVVQLDHGVNEAPKNDSGAFFNFAFTSQFKALQANMIAELFSNGKVKDGDLFFFTDYWNPTVFTLRYVAALYKIKVKIVGICHAGLWDPQDMLTAAFGSEEWGHSLESALDAAYDKLFFATGFSKNLYCTKYQNSSDRCVVTGFPMEYYANFFEDYDIAKHGPKQNIVCFPHRKAPEKKYEEFLKLKEMLPQYEFIVAMDVCKTKDEYHNLLYRSKICFSAATQETLGISMGIEALIAQCAPIIPDRLSYAEMFYGSTFFFEEDSLDCWKDKIISTMENYHLFVDQIKEQRNKNREDYFSGKRMYEELDAFFSL